VRELEAAEGLPIKRLKSKGKLKTSKTEGRIGNIEAK